MHVVLKIPPQDIEAMQLNALSRTPQLKHYQCSTIIAKSTAQSIDVSRQPHPKVAMKPYQGIAMVRKVR